MPASWSLRRASRTCTNPWGSILPLPWRNPNEGIDGGVRRVALESFLLRGGIAAIYEPEPGVDRAALAEFASARERERKPFDGKYDASDPSRYYCVEFVARALEAAGATPIPATPTTRNPSMHVGLDWLGIDTPAFLLAGDLVREERRVALVSRRFTEAEISRYFALKRELHRRFTDDQRVGNVLFWRGQSLHLRPGVDRYYEVGVFGAADPVALADQMFGPNGCACRRALRRGALVVATRAARGALPARRSAAPSSRAGGGPCARTPGRGSPS